MSKQYIDQNRGGGDPWLPSLDHRLIESPIVTALAKSLVSFLINLVSRCRDEAYLAYFSSQEAQLIRSIPLSNNAMEDKLVWPMFS